MSKVLFWGDIHVHPHKRSSDRLQDCIDCLDWVFRTAVDREIEDIIFLGDLFHDRQKIDVLTYQKTFEVFLKYLRGNRLRVWLLLGNHDLWHFQKWDVSSCHPLGAIEGVYVVNSPQILVIEGYPIAFLPYTHNPVKDLEFLEGKFTTIANGLVGDNYPRILCGHLAVNGALWNTKHQTFSEVIVEHDGDMVKLDPSWLDSWDRVFLGHYHASQELNDFIEYVGSPLQLSFGEAEQKKHVLIYDLDTKEKEYVENQFSPKHYILTEDRLSQQNLKDQFVRVSVEDMSASSVVEMQKKLVDNGVKTVQIQQAPRTDEHVVIDAKAILYKQEEMLDQYLDQVDLEGLNKKKLLTVGRKICQGGQE